MTRDEIYSKVRDVLVDALAVDEDEVAPDARLTADLGAESIDFLDIVFKLEQAFGFKIAPGGALPRERHAGPPVCPRGARHPRGADRAESAPLPHADFSKFANDPQIAKVAEVFTVDTLVNFVQKKLGS